MCTVIGPIVGARALSHLFSMFATKSCKIASAGLINLFVCPSTYYSLGLSVSMPWRHVGGAKVGGHTSWPLYAQPPPQDRPIIIIIIIMCCEVLGIVPVLYHARWSWSFHLSLGCPILLFPCGLYFSACLGILSVLILSTCCSHCCWYCFTSKTMFCTPWQNHVLWIGARVGPRDSLNSFADEKNCFQILDSNCRSSSP
jgi:hypothetical protein